ncbi:SDR family oxidoreductase [Natronospirillum operosum]|uniref:SDR family oxidoreductase n=1 Tax=Natronospirillum operosum TaxID=2759953 RepID=A0A4Z0WBX9_9GAMM|nr:SDR family oxidoreductase [Natronospirillum operosum]TGG91715.1 SDR family oxidoreductase [Natronospirillum operosum]
MSKKIFLVTGGNKGIGKAITTQLAQAGHTVYLGARKVEEGMKAAEELKAIGDVRFVQLDLTDLGSQAAAAEQIQSQSGHLDGLINNAGIIADYGMASGVRLENLRTTFETNYFGTIMVTQHMLPLLRAGSSKVIVNVSTGLGSITQHGDPSWPFHGVTPLAYNSSKAALNMFTVLLAKELRDEGFRVNAVSPGWIATDLGGDSAPGTPEEGAQIAVKCALEGPDGATGLFLTTGGVIPW